MTIPFRKPTQLLIVIMTCSMILYACATPPPAVIEADPGLLRVGVSTDAPPLIFKQNDEVSGLEAEMALALADYLEKTAVFVEVPWEDQIPALLENRTDIIMSGMSINLARQYKIAFSKPYFKSGLMIIAKDLQQFTFIKNRETAFAQSILWRIGVVKGTTGEAFIRQKSTGAKAIRAFSNQDEALQALIAGSIDVFVHDAPIVLMMAAQHQTEGLKPLPIMLNDEHLAWGMRKDDPGLVEAVNAFIDQAMQKGTMQTTIKRWIPMAE